MIQAVFRREKGVLTGAEIFGHAGYADSGLDVVCASVTSAVQLCCNGITEVLGAPAEVSAEENLIRVSLCAPHNEAQSFLQALYLHLTLLEEDYSDYLTTTVTEV